MCIVYLCLVSFMDIMFILCIMLLHFTHLYTVSQCRINKVYLSFCCRVLLLFYRMNAKYLFQQYVSLWEGSFTLDLIVSKCSSHLYNTFLELTQSIMDSSCLLFLLSVSVCWGSDDPWQCSDDVLKQWCMKYRQIKTFVLLHWPIIWQIGAPSCVYHEGGVCSPSSTQ